MYLQEDTFIRFSFSLTRMLIMYVNPSLCWSLATIIYYY